MPGSEDDADTLTIVVDDEDASDAGDQGDGGTSSADDAPQTNAEAERIAALMGWKPKDSWKGDTAGWRSAEDFLKETPEVLRNMRKKSERLEGQFSRIVATLTKVQQGQQKQEDRDLAAQMEAAVDAGDMDAAKKLLEQAKTSRSPDSGKPPALVAFEERNAEWFGVDDEATAYVSALDVQFARAAGGNQNIDPDQHMRKIEAAVKKRFPELFGTPAATNDDDGKGKAAEEARKGPLLARGNRGAQRATDGKLTVATMSPRQRAAARETNVTDADYVREYNNWQHKEAG